MNLDAYLLAVLSAVCSSWLFRGLTWFGWRPWRSRRCCLPQLAKQRPLHRFLLGYAAGIIYWFGVCYWIQTTLELYAGVGAAGSWALFALFCLAKAIHMGVFALLAGTGDANCLGDSRRSGIVGGR